MKTTGFPVKTTGLEGLAVPWSWSWAGPRVGKGLVVGLELLTRLAAGVGLLTGDTPRVGKGLAVAAGVVPLGVLPLGVVLLVVLAAVVVLLVVLAVVVLRLVVI